MKDRKEGKSDNLLNLQTSSSRLSLLGPDRSLSRCSRGACRSPRGTSTPPCTPQGRTLCAGSEIIRFLVTLITRTQFCSRFGKGTGHLDKEHKTISFLIFLSCLMTKLITASSLPLTRIEGDNMLPKVGNMKIL